MKFVRRSDNYSPIIDETDDRVCCIDFFNYYGEKYKKPLHCWMDIKDCDEIIELQKPSISKDYETLYKKEI